MSRTRQRPSEEIEPTMLSRPTANGLARERVSDIQRARILSAMVEVAAERGAAGVSVAHVVARSGVSRRTFYEIFAGREDCFLAAFDEAIERIATTIVPVYERPGSWRAKTRAALTKLLELLEDEPGTGRLVIVESLGAGPTALERRARVLARVFPAIDQGRNESKSKPQPPSLTAEGVVGGALSVLHARLTAASTRSLIDLVNPLMGMIVLPYLGPAAAQREVDLLLPKRATRRKRARRDPLQDLDMRLTYRTVRVLMAAAAHPGSSNRTIGDGAGIEDQGQISKLLARLHGLGLIGNAGAGPARGEPNAWTLTARGWEVHAAIAEQISTS
jgi:AcrR family transcriptional regulator